MLLFCTLCTLLIGFSLGGRLSRFERAGLQWLLLPIVAVLCQSAMTWLPGLAFAPLLLVGSYLLLFLFLWHNRHLTLSTFCLGLGSLCNLAVIAANHFAMPVSTRALSTLSAEGAAALLSGEIPMYRAADSATRLLFLGDVFWFPVPFFQGFASLGDILLCVGVFCLLMTVMGPTRLVPHGKREAPPAAARHSS
jgi:hypothetical protein